MGEIILYLMTMLIIFGTYCLFLFTSKKRLKKFSNNTYVSYLVGVYKLDKEKINMKQLALIIAMINSFVIATTVLIVSVIENMILMFVLGFIILIPLQLLMYHIVGKIFQKRFRREK